MNCSSTTELNWNNVLVPDAQENISHPTTPSLIPEGANNISEGAVPGIGTSTIPLSEGAVRHDLLGNQFRPRANHPHLAEDATNTTASHPSIVEDTANSPAVASIPAIQMDAAQHSHPSIAANATTQSTANSPSVPTAQSGWDSSHQYNTRFKARIQANASYHEALVPGAQQHDSGIVDQYTAMISNLEQIATLDDNMTNFT
jgi:hypothetical protein